MSGIRINMTTEEASSAPKTGGGDPIPTGKYLVAVTDCTELECGLQSKNPGKPYYNFELTVQGGEYAEKSMYTNAMLFSGALYTISQMLKAQGVEVRENGWFQVEGYEECVVPEPGWWLGRQMVVYGKQEKGKIKEKGLDKSDPDNFYPDRTEPKAFWPADTWDGSAAATSAAGVKTQSTATSLLP